MATVMPVTQSMSLPVEPLGLLLAVDTIPDVFATLGNVTGRSDGDERGRKAIPFASNRRPTRCAPLNSAAPTPK